ncbi:polysaccharide lyase domain-containing protein [Pochonia chlamydosporia 170]|uniref:Polysaccharide lyase domain-containing protein n=1 Tax=Pochonia chlamydosporia 170 TaxID=1380566 RepID=A0A179FG56_METCM|nr:polysaccharide lyase domain-containing protein [Pochonia chlamydosporia 170]OAQ64328.1 polysaccharide lyase domain-containing protein [Pochonia chlamydosporia 170]
MPTIFETLVRRKTATMALQLLVCFCLLFSVTLGTTTPKILDPDLVFREDFESGNLDQWDIQACPNGVTIVTDVARNGTHSAKFTVSDDDKHDKCSQVPTDSPRAQLVSNQ